MSLRKSIHNFYLAIVSEKSIKMILALAFLLCLALLLKNILIIFLMLAIAIISLLHNLFTRNTIGFELVTFCTVFCAMKFGAAAGIFVGVFAILIGMMLSRNIDEGIFVVMICFGLIGFFASLFDISHIFIVGFIATIVYDIIVVGFYILMGSNALKSVSYAFTHIMLNYFIFMYLPQFLKF
jgi:hypothetical protein